MRRFDTASSAAWLGLTLMVGSYCWLIWVATGIFAALRGFDPANDVPFLTRVLAGPVWSTPYHVVHWQVLAALILAGFLAWGVRRAERLRPETAHGWPLGLCLTTVLTLGCWQLAVLVSPFVAIGYVLK